MAVVLTVTRAKDLVCYTENLTFLRQDVVAIREFHIAVALLEGRHELLSELVPSQWGNVHLFDLCCRFGCFDTAWAMAQKGVPGCVLAAHHIERPSASPYSNYFNHEFDCLCQGKDVTCKACCFGFGSKPSTIWMDDFDARLESAWKTALRTAEFPLVCAILQTLRSGDEWPCAAVTDEAMAHILDICMLIGDKEAAIECAKHTCIWPVRRWRSEDLFQVRGRMCSIDDSFFTGGPIFQDWVCHFSLDVLIASFAVGAGLQDLTLLTDLRGFKDRCFPLRAAVALFGELDLLARWRNTWLLSDLFECGNFKANLVAAEKAGIELNTMTVRFFFGTCKECNGSLLDLSIWLGKPDCATVLPSLGVSWLTKENGDWLKRLIDLKPSTNTRRPAAKAGAHAALRCFWKSELNAKGVAVLQLLKTSFRGKPFPPRLVRHILLLAMDVPEILDQLDLWEDVKNWHDPQHHCFNRTSGNSSGEQGTVGAPNEAASAEGSLPEEPPASSGEPASTRKSQEQDVTEMTMQALQASREQMAPLNMDGVCLFRLTRMAKTEHVQQLLLNPDGPLAALHARVLEAGCEVNPDWSPVKVLFVPITEAQMNELQDLADFGYELRRDVHLLALQEDQRIIEAAFRNAFPSAGRPKLKQVGPTRDVPNMRREDGEEAADDSEDDGPWLALEGGFQTDSSVGYPSYSRAEL